MAVLPIPGFTNGERVYCPFLDCRFETGSTGFPVFGQLLFRDHCRDDHTQYFLDHSAAKYSLKPIISLQQVGLRDNRRILDAYAAKSNKWDISYDSFERRSSPGPKWTAQYINQWLAMHDFSREWRDTMRALNIEGDEFLSLAESRSNISGSGKMHSTVYPELARICDRNGAVWNQSAQRGEGKRLRELIAANKESVSEQPPALYHEESYLIPTHDSENPYLRELIAAAKGIASEQPPARYHEESYRIPAHDFRDPYSSKLTQWTHDMPSSGVHYHHGGKDPSSTGVPSYAYHDPASCGIVYARRDPPSVGAVHATYNAPSLGVIHSYHDPPSVGVITSHYSSKHSVEPPHESKRQISPPNTIIGGATPAEAPISGFAPEEYPYPEPWLSPGSGFHNPAISSPSIDVKEAFWADLARMERARNGTPTNRKP